MPINIGTADRVLRIALGVVLLLAPFVSGLALFEQPAATVASIAIALVMLGTSTIRFCPLYRLIGMRTCKPAA